jgi:hypothetical protein
METCPGCGGRNPPELQVCPFCQYRLGAQTHAMRWLRPTLAGILLLALLVGVVIVVLIQPAWLHWL